MAAVAIAALGPRKALAEPAMPEWATFEFIVKGPHQETDPLADVHYFNHNTTVGWKATWHDGLQYGDFIIIDPSECPPSEETINLFKSLLTIQADDVRHALLKEEGWPCRCAMCKAEKILMVDDLFLRKGVPNSKRLHATVSSQEIKP